MTAAALDDNYRCRPEVPGQAQHGRGRLAAAWVTEPVNDTQCGCKAFRHAAARDLFASQRVTSMVFDVEILHLAGRRGYSMATVPVHWSDKRGSRMRARAGLALQVLFDLARIPVIHISLPRLRPARPRHRLP